VILSFQVREQPFFSDLGKEMEDILFDKIQAYTIHKLRFSKRDKSIGNYRLSDPLRTLVSNWAMKHYLEWDPSFERSGEDLIKKRVDNILNEISIWVEDEYKNKSWEQKRYKIKYQKTRKDDTMTYKELGLKKQQDGYNTTLEAYNKAIEQGIKPTIMNLVEISGLNKNTINKYLRMIKNGTTPYNKGEN